MAKEREEERPITRGGKVHWYFGFLSPEEESIYSTADARTRYEYLLRHFRSDPRYLLVHLGNGHYNIFRHADGQSD